MTDLVDAEVKQKKQKSYGATFRSTLFTVFMIVAAAVFIANFWLPVMQVTGSSMAPTLMEGEIVAALKNSDFEKGDIIAFYYNDKILIKRIIAVGGDQVNISTDGVVSVNNMLLDEDYVIEPSLGDCNINLPYQVPEERYFVMGDHRSISLDSRNTAVGCVAKEQVIGRLFFRVWPLKQFGMFEAKGDAS